MLYRLAAPRPVIAVPALNLNLNRIQMIITAPFLGRRWSIYSIRVRCKKHFTSVIRARNFRVLLLIAPQKIQQIRQRVLQAMLDWFIERSFAAIAKRAATKAEHSVVTFRTFLLLFTYTILSVLVPGAVTPRGGSTR
jgi:hypothetical protein